MVKAFSQCEKELGVLLHSRQWGKIAKGNKSERDKKRRVRGS
jgi:hypothetical protein